ncbi:MAG: MaoC family dehydratase [Myxococcaceae bacterium]
MSARKLYFDSVRVGDELPALAKSPIDRVQLARYAGATGDFNPVHVDETFARGLGMPSVYAPGMMVMGMLAQLLSDWAKGGQLRRYSVKFSRIVWPGDTVVCKGRVSDRLGENGHYLVDVDLWAENQKGELVMRGLSTVQLFYSAEDESRQRAGQGPVVVNFPRESLKAAASAAVAANVSARSKKVPSKVTAGKHALKRAAAPAKSKAKTKPSAKPKAKPKPKAKKHK